MIGLSVLGFFLVGNALVRLIALGAPQSWCARIWNPAIEARSDESLARRAYRQRMVLTSAALYLWLGLWMALLVLFNRGSGNASLLLLLAFVIPLVGLVPFLLVVRGRPSI